jgi:hydroxyethylthiazole kinase-like sugar kinase family protein
MRAEEVLRRIGDERPLVHHITNYVSVSLVANVTLSTGALPVMAHAREEVEEMTSLASALVLNIGTLDPGQIESMLLDYVSDGERTLSVENGHALMSHIVGLGCASTAVVGCFAAAGGEDPETVAEALAFFGRAGELAGEGAGGPGTFEPRLLDAIVGLAAEPDGLEGKLNVKEASLG